VLAAQLIRAGKRPYLDFLFPQTPLNAYWVAMWMRVFGQSWRMIHAWASTLTILAILLTSDYVLRRFPVAEWRLPLTLVTIVTVGLNTQVFQFGAIGQAYGFCIFAIVLAFRFTVLTPDRGNLSWPALAGFAAGAAAAGSLLTAPVAPVLFLWLFFQNRTGNRWIKSVIFLAGVILAFLPLIWLLVEDPRKVLFNIFDYHFYYRQMDWEGAIQHDIEVLVFWVDSSQALLLASLAAAGLFFTARRSNWDRALRGEFYLCGWLALAESIHIANAHPTFGRYFLFTVPFLAILAAAGLYWISSRLFEDGRLWTPVVALTIFSLFAVGKAIYERRDNMDWNSFEQVAKKVQKVTPPSANLMADEFVYFLLRREPPSGFEVGDSHKLNNLDSKVAASMHVLPRKDLDQQVAAGRFQAVETCDDDDDRIVALHLPQLYTNREEVSGCVVYWNWAAAQRGASPAKNESRMNRR